jgi:hypothetical protein
VRRYGGKNPWRFFVPPLLVLVVALSVVVGVLQLTDVVSGWPSAILSLVYLGPIAYLLLVLWVSLTQDHVPQRKDRWLFLVVLPTMHLSWGAGFLFALLRGASRVTDTSRTGI